MMHLVLRIGACWIIHANASHPSTPKSLAYRSCSVGFNE
jgi:hypothetical protein